MTIRSASRPPHRTDASRIRRRRTLLIAALITVPPIATAHTEPALAHVAVSEENSAVVTTAQRDDAVQRYTVPASVQLPRISRTAEVTARASRPPKWVLPAPGALRDGFGPRPNAPVAGVSGYHRGQDIGASCGAVVRAAAAGRVIEAGWGGTYGNWVLLQHAGGVQTGYAHAERLFVRRGQQVKAGTVIAGAGSTGASSGCHLHFEVRVQNTAINPVVFMRTRQLRLGAR